MAGTAPRFALHTLSLAIGTALLVATAHADSEDDDSRLLNPLVVTPALMAQTVDESLSAVTVIDRDAIERRQPRDFTELMRGQPGIDVVSNGAFGKTTSVFTRGTSSSSTVLLVDGIRLRSATSGTPSWQHLPTPMLQRAEIVRGSRGSLYGADAVGGVVQVFTRDNDGEDRHWLRLGGGEFDSREAGVGVSGSEGNTRYSLSVNHFATDGAPVVRGGEDKPYRNTSALASVGHQFDNGVELSTVLLRSNGRTHYEGGYQEFLNQTAGVKLDVPVNQHWRTSVQLSEARDDTEAVDNYPGYFDTRTRSARFDNTVLLGERHYLVVGADYLEDRVTSLNSYDEQSRDNVGVFGQLTLGYGDTTVQANLRWDDNEAFGTKVTGGVALGLDIDGVHRARASYATAFRAPTFNDLYYPGSGNPDVNPETSATVELGLRAQYDHWFWDAALYQMDVDDLIAWAPSAPGSPVWVPMNVDKARIRGAELQSGTVLAGWQLQLAATFTDARDARTDNWLPRRARDGMRVDVDRQFGAFGVGASALAQSHRFENAANSQRLAGYGQLDLRASWAFHPRWTARLSVENLFDKQYELARGYINAGRYAFLSVQYQSR